MVKKKKMTCRLRTGLIRFASVLLIMLVTVMLTSPGFAFAATETKQKDTKKEEPIREVHDVGVDNELYCFFVRHNVVLTPAEVAKMTDEELTATILDRAGLYMKKTNCKKASHKEISVKKWGKMKKGELQLVASDIEEMRLAEPVDGSPVKFYMDLNIVKKTGEMIENEEGEEVEEVDVYSTYKRTSPRLLFAVVATEEDAKYGEDICKEDPPKKQKVKKQQKQQSKVSTPAEPPEEMLPEYRTINMADRSGDPIEDTLKDGEPVSLEWKEPAKAASEDEKSFIDRIPGGMTGLACMAAAAAAAVVGIIIAVKRKRTDE